MIFFVFLNKKHEYFLKIISASSALAAQATHAAQQAAAVVAAKQVFLHLYIYKYYFDEFNGFKETNIDSNGVQNNHTGHGC